MDSIARLAAEAARRILEPTPELPAIEVESFDWQWRTLGNESPQELAALDHLLVEAKRFVSDMVRGAEPRWLTLVGMSGAGKTHLAIRLREFVKMRGRAIYERHDRPRRDPHGDRIETLYSYAQAAGLLVKWTKLMDEMREGSFDRYKATGSDWFKIIDDFGLDSFDHTGTATMLARGKMASLCDSRLRKWTVFTTNFTRAQLGDEFDRRIPSRMMRDGSALVDASCVRDYNLRRELSGRKAA